MATPVSLVNSRNSRSVVGNSSDCNHHAPRKVTVTGAGAGLRQPETMQKSRTTMKGNVFCNGRCGDTRMFMKKFLEPPDEFSSKTHFLFPHPDTRENHLTAKTSG